MKTLILNSQEIIKSTNLDGLRNSMSEALKNLSQAEGQNHSRHVVSAGHEAQIGFMAAHSQSLHVSGYKTVSVFKNNSKMGLNPHQGMVVLIDPLNGTIKALLEGSSVTALRTAAASAAATDVLSRKNSTHLGILGSGRQAFEHIKAITRIREIKKISVWSPNFNSLQKFIVQVQESFPNIELSTFDTPQKTIKDADIVVSCTASPIPLISIHEFSEGTHINAIGACRPGQREISIEDRKGLRIYMDSRKECMAEAEELIHALNSGDLNPLSILGELGESILGKISGRRTPDDITMFKSVGLGIEDVFAAQYIYNQAQLLNLGTQIELG